MNVLPPGDESDRIRSAIWFISTQIGGVTRVLTHHRQSANGLCVACSSVRLVRWPCPVASMAMLARTRLERPESWE
jgi:hypothetical protein